MNLYWIAGLALFVLLEKIVPAGHWLSFVTGVALLVWGAGMCSRSERGTQASRRLSASGPSEEPRAHATPRNTRDCGMFVTRLVAA